MFRIQKQGVEHDIVTKELAAKPLPPVSVCLLGGVHRSALRNVPTCRVAIHSALETTTELIRVGMPLGSQLYYNLVSVVLTLKELGF